MVGGSGPLWANGVCPPYQSVLPPFSLWRARRLSGKRESRGVGGGCTVSIGAPWVLVRWGLRADPRSSAPTVKGLRSAGGRA